MNDAVDEPGPLNNRDHLSHLSEQARAWRQMNPMSQLNDQTRAWMKGGHLSHLSEQARAWRQIDPMSRLTDQTRAWMKGDHLSHLSEQARAWKQIDPISQLSDQIRAWVKGDNLSYVAEQARAWGQANPISQLTDQTRAWVTGDHTSPLAEQVRILSRTDQLSQLADQARAWMTGKQSSPLAEQVRILSRTDHLSQLANQARAWLTGDHLELARQTLPEDLTFKALLNELAYRSPRDVEASASAHDLELVSAAEAESASVGDLYVTDTQPKPSAKPTLSGAPTWLLYLWLLCIMPVLDALTHWEDVRQGLVDINERIPEAYSLASLRRFISSNLAGKPGDIRLVTGSDVRLRVAPGMKSAVLMTLPKYAPVVVLDKKDRTWIYVSYVHEGFLIDGYVSTKFLRKVRK